MIARIWHGWTHPENAADYEKLLREEIFESINKRNINGYRGIELLKKNNGDEIEFITIMKFDHFDAVKEFAGEKFDVSVVPPRARLLLTHYDKTAQHYEIIEERK